MGDKGGRLMDILKKMTNKEKLYQVISVASFVLSALLNVLMTVLILDMFNNILGGKGFFNNIPHYWIALVITLVFKGGLSTIADLYKHQVGFQITARIRENITLKLKQFSVGF